MTVQPQVKKLLEYFESRDVPPTDEMTVDEARKSYEAMCSQLNKKEEVYQVEDIAIKGYKSNIGLRVYTPEGEGPHPALVYYHGGGWVIGNLNTHDAFCRSVTNQAHCVVIAVDYSLSPEAKFPVAVEDSYLAAKWVNEHALELNIDPERIAVGGDSAGGNLATVVSYLARERKSPSIMYQLLIYPSVGGEITDSMIKYSEGYHLTKGTMKWFREKYFSDPKEMEDPLASPILIDSLEGMPPAYIMTAEYDPLVDGGEAYANRLKNAGVETEYVCCEGLIHGFITMTEAIDDAKKAITNLSSALNKAFSKINTTQN